MNKNIIFSILNLILSIVGILIISEKLLGLNLQWNCKVILILLTILLYYLTLFAWGFQCLKLNFGVKWLNLLYRSISIMFYMILIGFPSLYIGFQELCHQDNNETAFDNSIGLSISTYLIAIISGLLIFGLFYLHKLLCEVKRNAEKRRIKNLE